jgi:hypothetical protein
MQELGDLLRKAREAKCVTPVEAEEATRIRVRYLEALEHGDEDSLPARVYVEGFLRNYAVYLGLEPQEVMARYRALRSPRHYPCAAVAGCGALAASSDGAGAAGPLGGRRRLSGESLAAA